MTVVAGGGQLRSVGAKAWPLAGLESPYRQYGTEPMVQLAGDVGASTFLQLYRRQPWVFVAANKITQAIARLPLKSYRIDETTGNRDRIRDHPLPELLRRPYALGSQYSLLEGICLSMAVHCNALVVKERPVFGRAPVALWLLPWERMKVLAGRGTPIDGYEYTTTAGKRRIFMPDEVLHFRLNSIDGIQGISFLEPLARTLILEDAAQRHMISQFNNGIRPSSALVIDGKLQKQQKDELTARLNAQHGGPDNSGRMLLLEGNVKDIKPLSFNAEESEVVAHRKLNREEVAAAYQIDPTQIGILDRATYSNVNQAHVSFYMDTLGPWVAAIEDTFHVQLIDQEPEFAGTFVEFDMADVLKGDIETRSQAYQRFLLGATMTPNEIRKLENLPPIDDRGADSLWAPTTHVALDGRLPSPAGTPVGVPALASTNGNSGS